MPRLTRIKHPYFGELPVNPIGDPCPSCGSEGAECYLMCPESPAYQSADAEREEALATEHEIAVVGFMAWDSAQHRAHGLPCPYDGYDPCEPDHEDTLAYMNPPCEPFSVATPTRYVPDPPAWPDDDDLPF